jgi:hypothetical protein
MAIKTFTTGEVLTASDTNTYLTNGGLTFIKGVSQTSAVASINITSCFSATWDAYRIVLSSVTLTTNANSTYIYCKLLSGTTPSNSAYNYGIPRVDMAAGTVSSVYIQGGTAGIIVGSGNASDSTSAIFDVANPFAARYTNFHGLSITNTTGGYSGAGSGAHGVLASYDGIQISASAGNISNAAIIVYGYRYGIG